MQPGGDQDGFVSGAADLKVDQALALELDFLVVDPPRQDHRAVGPEEIVAGESGVIRACAIGVRASAVADRRSLHSCATLVRSIRGAGRGPPITHMGTGPRVWPNATL